MRSRGKPMPEGWVIHSKTGKPITDPKKVGEGVLLPIGGHKGSGLALMIGLLAGVLNGAAFGHDVVDFIGAGQRRDQHRAIRGRARRLALPAARCLRGRDGSPYPRSAAVADAAGLRSDPHAGRGPAQAPRRAQRERRGACRRALIKQLDELAASLKIKPLRRAELNGALPCCFVDPGAHVRQHLGQQRLDLRARHAGLDAPVVENVEQVLIVDDRSSPSGRRR